MFDVVVRLEIHAHRRLQELEAARSRHEHLLPGGRARDAAASRAFHSTLEQMYILYLHTIDTSYTLLLLSLFSYYVYCIFLCHIEKYRR